MLSRLIKNFHANIVNSKLPGVEGGLIAMKMYTMYLIKEIRGNTMDGCHMSIFFAKAMPYTIQMRHGMETIAGSAAMVTRRSQGDSLGRFQEVVNVIFETIKLCKVERTFNELG